MRFLLTPNVGLLGLDDANYIAIGKTSVNQADLELYANYKYDSGVLGIAVLMPPAKPRYLPLYCSVYRGMPPVQVDVYVSANSDGLWIEASWDGRQAEPLEYFDLSEDGSPKLSNQDSYFPEPTPPSFAGYNNQQRKRDETATKVLSVSHDGE